jgi:hypothetical protein
MGAAFCVVFKSKVTPYGKVGGDSIALLRGYEKLDKLAAKDGLRTLGSFLSTDPKAAAEMLDMEGIDVADLDLPAEQWFDPAEGLAAVEALIRYLGENPKAARNAKEMLSELKQVVTELTAAKRAKVKFHFDIVP